MLVTKDEGTEIVAKFLIIFKISKNFQRLGTQKNNC
jgi:hypothetical protein